MVIHRDQIIWLTPIEEILPEGQDGNQ